MRNAFLCWRNDQKEQNGFKKLKIHKNQIIYLRTFFSYDDKKAKGE
jgi:Mg2+/citrate complex secondary transporter